MMRIAGNNEMMGRCRGDKGFHEEMKAWKINDFDLDVRTIPPGRASRW